MDGACGTCGRIAYKVLVEKPEGKKPFGITKRRWEYDIKINIKETQCEGVNWIYLAHDKDKSRDMNTAVRFR